MALRDQSVLDTVAREEREDPLPQKKYKDRTIYLSRNDLGFQVNNLGRPVITDFGLSVYGDNAPYTHTIQPSGFRAPEVIIGAGWDYSVDIWNLGALVRLNDFNCYLGYSNSDQIWELLCGAGPFDYPTLSLDSSSIEEKHLASIISLIGSPPQDLLERGKKSSQYFNEDGI